MAARRVGDDLGEPRVAHPPGQPLFVGEGGGGLRVVVLGAQGLQHAGLAAGVVHAVEQGDDGFVEQGVHRQPVELLAGLEARRQGQLAQAGDVVAQAFGGQGVDPQHQGGAVVLAATAFGRHGEAGGGGLGVGFGLQDVGDLPVAELAPDAVAHQRKYIAGLQLAVGVVHRQVGVEADGAGQHVLQLRVFPHVVGAELLQPAAPQPVDARVPHVGQVVAPPAQHDGRQRGSHAGSFAGARGVGHQPAVEGLDDGVEGLVDGPGVGRRVVNPADKCLRR